MGAIVELPWCDNPLSWCAQTYPAFARAFHAGAQDTSKKDRQFALDYVSFPTLAPGLFQIKNLTTNSWDKDLGDLSNNQPRMILGVSTWHNNDWQDRQWQIFYIDTPPNFQLMASV